MGESESGSLWFQYTAALSATLSIVSVGASYGWATPVIPLLTGPNSPIPLKSDQAAWVVSLITLGCAFGCIVAPFIVDRIGPKRTILLAAAPDFLGWTLILSATSPATLYAARFISGLGQGLILTVCTVYIAEIADKKIRGTLGMFLKIGSTAGSLYEHLLASYVEYKYLGYASLFIPVLFVTTFVWMPESPYYFLMNNDEPKAEVSLLRLRRVKDRSLIKSDLEAIKNAVEGSNESRVNPKDLFATEGSQRAMMIVSGIKFTQQFSGNLAILAYMQEIFELSGSSLSPSSSVIVLDVVLILTTILSAAVVDKLGRRPLLLVSGVGTAAALLTEGLFFYAKYKTDLDVSGFLWVPLAALMVYEIMLGVGIVSLPFVILGELFPPNIKTLAVGLVTVLSSIVAFVIARMYQVIADNLGIYTAFWFFAVFCLLGTLYVFYVLPETRGKTLEEIQKILNKESEEKLTEIYKSGETLDTVL